MKTKKYWDVDFWRVAAELFEGSDRACIIVGAEMLNLALEELLRARFVQDEKLSKKLLQQPNAPLWSFSTRIDLSYALGLLEDYEFKNFHAIRSIRNLAAHDPEQVSFEQSPIKDRAAQLTSPYMEMGRVDERIWFKNLLNRHITDIGSRSRSLSPCAVRPTDNDAMASLRAERQAWARVLVEERGFQIADGILVAPPDYEMRGKQH